jgi:DNA gyrase/topoisomerase IV subunit B
VSETEDREADDKKKEVLKQLNCLTDIRQYRLDKVENLYTRAKSELIEMENHLENARAETAKFEDQSKNKMADMKNEKMSKGINADQLLAWINRENQMTKKIEQKNHQLVVDEHAVTEFHGVVKERKKDYQQAMRKLEKIECLKQMMTEE